VNVMVIELPDHVAPGRLAEILVAQTDLNVTSGAVLPPGLEEYNTVVLNSLPINYDPAEDRLIRYVSAGGGLLCIHDTVFPGQFNFGLLYVAGVRYAFEAIVTTEQNGKAITTFELAKGDPSNQNLCFSVHVVPESATHPILKGIEDFEIAEEFWAINTAPGVKELLQAHVGDRIPCHPRFRQAITVCGCRKLGKGRIVFLLLGHYPQTYSQPTIAALMANAVRWLGGESDETSFTFDLFLSFSSHNESEAGRIEDAAKAKGLRVFMSKKDLASGDTWDDRLREALLGSRELAVLISPKSLGSEWVTTEWGIAWALQKRITPILLRCDVSQLPDRLKRYQVRDMHELDLFVDEVLSRGGG
jgi:hypothetical protein